MILSSDDFGLSRIYNRKMIKMTRLGCLSSISVMVERDLRGQACQFGAIRNLRTEDKLSLGLHFEAAASDDEATFDRQWKAFTRLLGVTPDYVDIHKAHFHGVNVNTVAECCLERRVHFRRYSETTISVSSPAQSVVATGMDIDAIRGWIGTFEANETYELVFHVGTFDPASTSSLNEGRDRDVQKLRLVCEHIADKDISVVSYRSL